MLNFIFIILMFIVFGKMLGFAIRAAWGVSKIVVSIILLPLFLLGLMLKGLLTLAFPILIIIGIVSLVAMND